MQRFPFRRVMGAILQATRQPLRFFERRRFRTFISIPAKKVCLNY
ncbi:MAG TPA: hypothetical protein VK633_07120 [Verrucomicrobiae bacterium]|nr:hypothetical protein [Verrucomicrobiae bacterium]